MTGPQGSQQDPHREVGPQASPRVKPWWGRRRVLLFGGIAVVVLALVVGLTAWLAGPAPGQNRDPFDQAVATLAAAPAVHYRSSALGGAMTWDVRLTSHDDAVGTITLDGQPVGVLTVGGKTFLKPPDGLLPDQGTNSAVVALKGKWITGRDLTGGGTFGPILKQLLSPSKLAQKLRDDALDKTADFPTTDDPGTTVNGVPALKAKTPAGDLYVAKNAPYRVLRLVSTDDSAERLPKLHSLPTSPSLPRMSSLSHPVPTSVSPSPLSPPTVHGVAFKLDDGGAQSPPSPTPPEGAGDEALGDTDFPSMSPEDVDNTFNDLQSATKQLSNSVDTDIQFKVSGNAVLHCSAASCVVTVNVTNHITSSAQRTVTGGQVTAELTATVEIEGRSAGGCTSTGSLPLNGTGQITCHDSAASAVFAAVAATKKAQAEAESKAAGGRPVTYTIRSTVRAHVNAIAQVNVQQEIQRLEQEKLSVDCATTTTCVATAPTTVKPYANKNPKATPDEFKWGKWLNNEAQSGRLPGVREVEGAPEIKGARSGDYRMIKTDGSKAPADLYQPSSGRIENIADNIISKSGQAETVIVELGRGKTANMGVTEANAIADLVLGTPGHNITRVIVVKADGTMILNRP